MFSVLGCLTVGGALHYVFRDASKSFDVTFGALIAAYGIVGYFLYQWSTERMAAELARSQRDVDEMLYRWIANGGAEGRFWELRSQVDVDFGDIGKDKG